MKVSGRAFARCAQALRPIPCLCPAPCNNINFDVNIPLKFRLLVNVYLGTYKTIVIRGSPVYSDRVPRFKTVLRSQSKFPYLSPEPPSGVPPEDGPKTLHGTKKKRAKVCKLVCLSSCCLRVFLASIMKFTFWIVLEFIDHHFIPKSESIAPGVYNYNCFQNPWYLIDPCCLCVEAQFSDDFLCLLWITSFYYHSVNYKHKS